MKSELLLTTVVGSYPQPDWLVNRENLKNRLPPRVRAREIWRVEERFLEAAQDDATLLAIRDMELAGIDIITDGEIRRESYSNRFATALDGFDIDNPGVALNRTGHPNPVPRVVGPVRRSRPIQVRDVEFARRNTDRRLKITLPGPFTIAQQAQNDYYPDDQSLAMDIAAAVNAEIRDLRAAGADVVQLDEPYLQARPEKAKAYALAAINRALVERGADRGARRATIDHDGTLIEAHKREARVAYEGTRGYQPLVAVWAEEQLVVADEFRDGNVAGGEDPLSSAQRALRHLPPWVTERYYRADTASYYTPLLKDLVREGVRFSIGADMT
ncbi:MAG: transposase, partial [Candidatus Rokubacteria bacterium]|nr:transposase [Candidatus Rokubacteria bacterium]